MFSKFSIVVVAALAILAAATPTPNEPASDCSTGDLQCCETTGTTSDTAVIAALGTLGIPIQSVTGLVGLTCDPITIVGNGGSCSESPVCCSDNSHGSLISIGCVPVTL